MRVVLSRDCAVNTSSQGHTILDFDTFGSMSWYEDSCLDLDDLHEGIREPRSQQRLTSLRTCLQVLMRVSGDDCSEEK